MAKKIYDIKPPKKEGTAVVPVKKKKTVRKMVAASVVKLSAPVLVEKRQSKRFPWIEIVVGGVVVLLLVVIWGVLKLPKATIEIWPKLDAFSQSEKIKIPAQYLEVVQSASQDFPASGSASNDGKAVGTIKVYNKISPSAPLTLKVGTHFLSDSGKYFVTLDRIVVPAMQGKTAGSISVKVQAEESGDSYNIGASKFSVPGLSGTSYYYNIWAESAAAMTGGFAGKVKKVTNADIASAKEVLSKKLLADAEASLRAKLSEDQILLSNALTKTVIDASSSAKADAVAETFKEAVKVKVTALVFKKSDLESLVKHDVTAILADGQKYLEKSLDVQYVADSVDMQGGTESLTVKIVGQKYIDIDTLALLDVVAQKSAEQIQQAIGAEYGANVGQVKVIFWPFWVKSAPTNKNRIIINLHFE